MIITQPKYAWYNDLDRYQWFVVGIASVRGPAQPVRRICDLFSRVVSHASAEHGHQLLLQRQPIGGGGGTVHTWRADFADVFA